MRQVGEWFSKLPAAHQVQRLEVDQLADPCWQLSQLVAVTYVQRLEVDQVADPCWQFSQLRAALQVQRLEVDQVADPCWQLSQLRAGHQVQRLEVDQLLKDLNVPHTFSIFNDRILDGTTFVVPTRTFLSFFIPHYTSTDTAFLEGFVAQTFTGVLESTGLIACCCLVS